MSASAPPVLAPSTASPWRTAGIRSCKPGSPTALETNWGGELSNKRKLNALRAPIVLFVQKRLLSGSRVSRSCKIPVRSLLFGEVPHEDTQQERGSARNLPPPHPTLP